MFLNNLHNKSYRERLGNRPKFVPNRNIIREKPALNDPNRYLELILCSPVQSTFRTMRNVPLACYNSSIKYARACRAIRMQISFIFGCKMKSAPIVGQPVIRIFQGTPLLVRIKFSILRSQSMERFAWSYAENTFGFSMSWISEM